MRCWGLRLGKFSDPMTSEISFLPPTDPLLSFSLWQWQSPISQRTLVSRAEHSYFQSRNQHVLLRIAFIPNIISLQNSFSKLGMLNSGAKFLSLQAGYLVTLLGVGGLHWLRGTPACIKHRSLVLLGFRLLPTPWWVQVHPEIWVAVSTKAFELMFMRSIASSLSHLYPVHFTPRHSTPAATHAGQIWRPEPSY